MEVFGSLGLTEECGMERLFRDARMLICPDGTSQIQEMVIGRFYTGHTGMALGQLFTCGGCGIWSLIDAIIFFTSNDRTDAQGRVLQG